MNLLKPFGRVTNRNYIPEIDGLRFLAIFPVLLLHTRTAFLKNASSYNENSDAVSNSWLDMYLFNGITGVVIFFCISGFILALPFANSIFYSKKKIPLKKYYYKRLTRLEPPFIIVMSVLFVLLLLQNQYEPAFLFERFLASIVYVHSILFSEFSPINPVTWSLEVEIQFYIIVPLITYIFYVKNKITRRSILLFIIYLSIYLRYNVELPFKILLSFGHYFLTGFLIADFFVTKDFTRLTIDAKYLDMLGIISILLIFSSKYIFIENEWGHPIYLFLIFYAALYGRIIKSIFSNQLISTLGGMCYITYLIHYPVAYILTKFTSSFTVSSSYEVNLIIQYIILVPIIFMACGIAFLIFEKPFMHNDWPQKLNAFLKAKIKNLQA